MKSTKTLRQLFLITVMMCVASGFANNVFAATSANRPTLRIAVGNKLEFCQYAAANGSAYSDCKLKIADIKQAWADVSDVVIEGTLEVKRTDPNTRSTAVFVANKLTMKDGAKIVTNGNVLLIFVNEFVSFNNASITAFEADNRTAKDGAPQTGVAGVIGINGLAGPPGNAGMNGESGGVVQIFAAQFSGPLAVDLSGQDGGNGSGGANGGNGLMGFKGEDASWGAFGCNHGGGGGGAGGTGGQGGIGGAAGQGGDGGVFGFFYVKSLSIDPPNNPKILVPGGKAGSPGQGGQGGVGGEGGLGGNGGGPCGGGPRGAHGAAGTSLGPGAPGPISVGGSSQIINVNSLAKIQEQFSKAATH